VNNHLKQLRRHFRLIPAVLVVGTVLLAVKATGLVIAAQAQEQQSGAASPSMASAPDQAANRSVQSSDPSGDDDAETSSAQVDVLSSLAKRRAELDGRERDLDMRENLIAAAEKRVDGKIDSLKQLQTSIQTLLVQRDTAEQKQLDALVKTYSSMKPRDAARIFDTLDEAVSLSVAAQMKPDVLAPILGAMQSEPAQMLTVRLASRLKVPETQTAQIAAAAQPLPAMPTAVPAPAAAAPAAAPPDANAPQAQPAPSTGKAAPPPAPAK
jgi:flagellar motility protein MotE (MotC chaperone)